MSPAFLESLMSEGVHYLYRGTTMGWPGAATTRLGRMTPTTTDPLIAALFAIEARNKGRAILLAVRRGSIPELNEMNHFTIFESAVNLDISPSEFAERAEVVMEVDVALEYLRMIGTANLPVRIQGNNALHEYLRDNHSTGSRLNLGQIRHFNQLMLGGRT